MVEFKKGESLSKIEIKLVNFLPSAEDPSTITNRGAPPRTHGDLSKNPNLHRHLCLQLAASSGFQPGVCC